MHVLLIALGLMLIVVVPVFVMTFWFAWRYRASNTRARYEPKWANSRKIETVIWVVPILIIASLGTVTWIYSHRLDPYKSLKAPKKAVHIEAISLDWKWLFIYPKYHVAAVNELAIPVNAPVKFDLTSDTVMTSLLIPRLGSQIYAMAGMRTELNLLANKPGTYLGENCQYSGSGFSHMQFRVHALPEGKFRDWIKKARHAKRPLDLARYQLLTEPRQQHPVMYFSSVKPHLFADVIAQYHNGNDGRVPGSLAKSTSRHWSMRH